jgi:hypothetical protein
MPGTKPVSPQGPILHIPPNGDTQSDYTPFLNIYEMGAVGATVIPGATVAAPVTGNGVTDDSVNINLAIAALAGTGYALYFPSGTFLVSTITVANLSNVPMYFGPGVTFTGTNALAFAAMGTWVPGADVTVPLTTGNVNLTTLQASAGRVILTGSLTGNASVTWPNLSVGQQVIVDPTGVTLNAHTVSAIINGNTWGTTIGATNLALLTIGQTKFFGTALTP